MCEGYTNKETWTNSQHLILKHTQIIYLRNALNKSNYEKKMKTSFSQIYNIDVIHLKIQGQSEYSTDLVPFQNSIINPPTANNYMVQWILVDNSTTAVCLMPVLKTRDFMNKRMLIRRSSLSLEELILIWASQPLTLDEVLRNRGLEVCNCSCVT